MSSCVNDLLTFIKHSPSAYHATSEVASRLKDAGYTALTEGDAWTLAPGGRYYVTRNLSSIIAFSLPEAPLPCGFMIAAAHSDSPSFKIKEISDSEVAGSYTRINVERYGGMLCSTWFDRPLSAAGKVTVAESGKVVSHLVDLDADLFMIPSVAIHMNRNANEGASYNAASDMQPIAGTVAVKGDLKAKIAKAVGATEDAVLATDLFLYPRAGGCIWGLENEFVSSPRLDDLQCVYGALIGFLQANNREAMPVLFVADNEEVGSSTKQGAASTFLYDVLVRVIEALGGSPADYRRAVARSFMVSADNAHAVHPNHPEYADPNHRPKMNEGIVIKHNAGQRYTTDSVSSAIFTAICRKADVPLQHFTNRPDLAGGSTLGNIANTQVSLNTVDIGLPQLAMHSCYETAGVKDTDYLVKAMTAFFSSSLRMDADGVYGIE